MKRLIWILTALISMSSCAVLTRETTKTTVFLDYRPYTEAGFFLSPNSYTGEYQPIGDLYIIVDPAVIPNTNSNNSIDGIYAQQIVPVKGTKMSSEELLEIAVKEAGLRGANGISNLSIEVTTEHFGYNKGKVSATIPVDRYIIRGLCIRIP